MDWVDVALGLLAGAMGALTGGAELVSRYRDEPYRSLSGRYGSTYLLVNAAASAGAYFLIASAGAFAGIPRGWLVLIAGFGAMAILRSKILTFTTKSQEEIPVGIDAVVTAFLQTADRGIDRRQSDERWTRTYGALHDVDKAEHLVHFLALLGTNLRSYQNVSQEEMADFNQTVSFLGSDSGLPIGLRCVAAGLAFQAIAGSGNFGKVVREFRAEMKLPPAKVLDDGPLRPLRRLLGGRRSESRR